MSFELHVLRTTWIAKSCVMLSVAWLSVAMGAKAQNDYGALFDAEGVEQTYGYCTACHSEMIVAQQGLSRTHWDELLIWMVDEQGMPEIDEPDRSIVLDYLAAHYGQDRPNFPRRVGD